jgi:hypothetical protein
VVEAAVMLTTVLAFVSEQLGNVEDLKGVVERIVAAVVVRKPRRRRRPPVELERRKMFEMWNVV